MSFKSPSAVTWSKPTKGTLRDEWALRSPGDASQPQTQYRGENSGRPTSTLASPIPTSAERDHRGVGDLPHSQRETSKLLKGESGSRTPEHEIDQLFPPSARHTGQLAAEEDRRGDTRFNSMDPGLENTVLQLQWDNERLSKQADLLERERVQLLKDKDEYRIEKDYFRHEATILREKLAKSNLCVSRMSMGSEHQKAQIPSLSHETYPLGSPLRSLDAYYSSSALTPSHLHNKSVSYLEHHMDPVVDNLDACFMNHNHSSPLLNRSYDSAFVPGPLRSSHLQSSGLNRSHLHDPLNNSHLQSSVNHSHLQASGVSRLLEEDSATWTHLEQLRDHARREQQRREVETRRRDTFALNELEELLAETDLDSSSHRKLEQEIEAIKKEVAEMKETFFGFAHSNNTENDDGGGGGGGGSGTRSPSPPSKHTNSIGRSPSSHSVGKPIGRSPSSHSIGDPIGRSPSSHSIGKPISRSPSPHSVNNLGSAVSRQSSVRSPADPLSPQRSLVSRQPSERSVYTDRLSPTANRSRTDSPNDAGVDDRWDAASSNSSSNGSVLSKRSVVEGSSKKSPKSPSAETSGTKVVKKVKKATTPSEEEPKKKKVVKSSTASSTKVPKTPRSAASTPSKTPKTSRSTKGGNLLAEPSSAKIGIKKELSRVSSVKKVSSKPSIGAR